MRTTKEIYKDIDELSLVSDKYNNEAKELLYKSDLDNSEKIEELQNKLIENENKILDLFEEAYKSIFPNSNSV